MTKEKKERTQYNWKFKENEAEEFYQWFDKQENIANSLRSILYHVIELYGIGNILDPGIQKQLVKNTLILESLKDKNVLSVNHDLLFADSMRKENNYTSAAAAKESKNQHKNSTEIKADTNSENGSTKGDIFGDIDTNLL